MCATNGVGTSARALVHASHEVVGQLDVLLGAPQDELAGITKTSPLTSTSSVSPGGSARSIAVTLWFSKTRKEPPRRRSTLAGCSARPTVDADAPLPSQSGSSPRDDTAAWPHPRSR